MCIRVLFTICKNCMSGKNLVLHCWPKMPSTNQNAVFFWSSIYLKVKEELSDILVFWHGNIDEGKIAWIYYFWLVVARYEGFFNHQFLLKESNDQSKAASETAAVGLMWPVVPPNQSDCRILWSARTNYYLWFFAWRHLSGEGSNLRLPLLVGCGQCVSGPIASQDS